MFNNSLFSLKTIGLMHQQAARLYEAAQTLKSIVGQSAVARFLNESPQTVKNWESRGISKVGAIKAQELIGCNATWLLTGVGRMSEDERTSNPEPINLDDHPDLVSVRTVKLRLQAGVTGFSVDVDQSDGPPIFFRAEWLQEKGYKPYQLVAMKIHGQSMWPTLHQGDMVVINTADTDPKDGVAFAINYEGEAMVKRIVRDAGVWWISSDNGDKARFPHKECHEGSCIIIGRVIHRQSEEI